MARLQILELPEGADDDRSPFVLVIDQASKSTVNALDMPVDSLFAAALGKPSGPSVAEQIGARAVLVFEETIDIPANDIAVDADGNPLYLKMNIEGDAEHIRDLVHDEIRKAQGELRRTIQAGRR